MKHQDKKNESPKGNRKGNNSGHGVMGGTSVFL